MTAIVPTRRFTLGIAGTAVGAALIAMAGVGLLGTFAAEEQLADARLAKAMAVGHAVQRDLHRALGHGIPLDRVEGMTAYLQGIAERNPDLHRLAVTAADGRTLHAAGPGSAEGPSAVRLPLHAGSAVVGHLLVAVDPGAARAQIAGELTGVVLGAAALLLLVAELAGALVQAAVRAPLDRLARALAAGAAGDFGTLLGRRPRDQIGRALLAFNAAVFHLHERRARFAAHAEEVRGAVFDPGIADQVEQTRARALERLGDGTATTPRRLTDARPGDVRAYTVLLSAAMVSGCLDNLDAATGLAALFGLVVGWFVPSSWTRIDTALAAVALGAAALLGAVPMVGAAGAVGLAVAARYARAAAEDAPAILRPILIGAVAALLWNAARGAPGGAVEAAVLAAAALPAVLPLVRRP
ncbi:HAMP domain-containing protein [Azospirillum sp.]|uniref:HAMP domain-containing protein n=1 Tax=Azospirillum sp. TaxID=34012 RepID=UPI003D71CB01